MTTRNWILTGLGLAATAATAYLLATDKGKKMRKDMMAGLGDWRDNLQHLAKQNGDALSEGSKNLKGNAARHLRKFA